MAVVSQVIFGNPGDPVSVSVTYDNAAFPANVTAVTWQNLTAQTANWRVTLNNGNVRVFAAAPGSTGSQAPTGPNRFNMIQVDDGAGQVVTVPDILNREWLGFS